MSERLSELNLPSQPHSELAPSLTAAQARAIVQETVRAHFARVRTRIPDFVDRTYAWLPALKINARGLGRDLYRAPLNAALVLPHVGLRLSAMALDRFGQEQSAEWLRSRPLFLKTDVAREIEWRVWTQLLELPYRDGDRVSTHDALAQALFEHPQIRAFRDNVERAYGRHCGADAIKERLNQAFETYSQSRAAAGEVASASVCLTAGAALLGKFTPSVLTLGPALADLIAAKTATLGAGSLTALWLGAVPIKAGAAATIAATTAAYVAAAATTAVSGALTDPVQRMAGLHHHRLSGIVDTMELAILGDEKARIIAHDHYAGRLIDLVDALTAALRLVPR